MLGDALRIAATGYLASLALIVVIGAQNAFILKQGIKGEHVFAVCLCCALMDAVLISTGISGFHFALTRWPSAMEWVRWAGVAFLLWYGYTHAKAAWQGSSGLHLQQGAETRPLGKTLLTLMALTLLNPHVYLDAVVLLGSLSVPYGKQAWIFAVGAITASFSFFFALGYGAALLRPVLATQRAWRILDGAIAFIMWGMAAALAVHDLPLPPST